MTSTAPHEGVQLAHDAAPPVPRSPRILVACALGALLLLGVDAATKHWALEDLSTARLAAPAAVCDESSGAWGSQRVAAAPVPVIDEIVTLEYAENCSASFGLARQPPAPARRILLASPAVLAVIAIFVALARGHGSRAFVWGVPFVAAGALGNMLDRVRLGYVVDFLHVQYRPWSFDYPVFNVADIWIAIGVALLVIGAGTPRRAEPEHTTAA